jgi:hypothetical protein
VTSTHISMFTPENVHTFAFRARNRSV